MEWYKFVLIILIFITVVAIAIQDVESGLVRTEVPENPPDEPENTPEDTEKRNQDLLKKMFGEGKDNK